MVQIMATISERTNKDGKTRYRAVIRINTTELKHTESRTFSKRSLAEAWAKKREMEIELNPGTIKSSASNLRLSDAIIRYLEEMGDNFGRSHKTGLEFVGKFAIGAVYIDKLNHDDFANFAKDRLAGKPPSLKPISPSTLAGDMVMIRTILRHAKFVWGINVNLSAFEDVVLGLRYARNIRPSNKRNRLPTSDELQLLTDYFYQKWHKGKTVYPMHLIMWFAIYSCRRESEITRLCFDDLQGDFWLLRDAKNPKGSLGNHLHIKISDDTLALIHAIKNSKFGQNNQSNYLFPLVSSNISASFTKACRMLGIDNLHFHDLRHEGATRLAEQGLTIPQIQQITGHESWSSLQRYTNLMPRPAVLTWQEALAGKI